MNSNRKTAIIIGIIILAQFIIGVLTKQILLGQETFEIEFLKTASANSDQIVLGVLIGLFAGTLSIIMAILLLPYFKKKSPNVSIFFIAFSIVVFIFSALEYFSILSLLSLSKEIVKSGFSSTKDFQPLVNTLLGTRWWLHFMALLISSIPLATFYYLLFRSKLIPRFISIWGFISAVLLAVAVLLPMFGQRLEMLLMLPLGLNQLFLSIWLIVKGFNKTESFEN